MMIAFMYIPHGGSLLHKLNSITTSQIEYEQGGKDE